MVDVVEARFKRKTADTPAPDSYAGRRRARYAARYFLWEHSTLRRARVCGRVAHDRDKGVCIRVRETPTGPRAAFGGVTTCGSVWACPVCSEKVQSERQADVDRALTEAARQGLEVGFLTFTVRHKRRRGQDLAAVWDAVNLAWREATSGSPAEGGLPKGGAWKRDCAEFGVRGYVRLTETTISAANGWHVHIHALVFFDPAGTEETRGRRSLRVDKTTGEILSDAAGPTSVWPRQHVPNGHAEQLHGGTLVVPVSAVRDFGNRMFDRWRNALRGTPFEPDTIHGFDAKKVVGSTDDLARYFAKGLYNAKTAGSTAYDVSGAHGKYAKRGNRTPFGLLADLVRDKVPAAGDLRLWHEWERVSKGRRQLLWSQGLRAYLYLGAERTDEEIAEDASLDGVLREWLSHEEWAAICRRRAQAACLEAAEADDTGERLCAWLHELVPPGPPPLDSDD